MFDQWSLPWRVIPSVLATLAGSTIALGAGPFPASIDLSSLNGSNGFVLNGVNAYDFTGWSVSSAGDVNGDGFDDILVSAFGADPSGQAGAGKTYVVFGDPGVGTSGAISLSDLNGTTGFVLTGIDPGDYSGCAVSSAGDVNGDGIDDILVGAYAADPNGRNRAGESYVVFGGPNVGASGSINLSTLDGATGFVVNGTTARDHSGWSVSAAGDFNGDGINDVLIGAFNARSNGQHEAGKTYVVFGKDTAVAGLFDASINLAFLDGTSGFVINGIDEYDHSGRSVSSAGDVNGDGIDDILIGADRAGPNEQYLAGESYVVFGSPTVGAAGSINLSGLDGTNGFVVKGIDANDHSGASLSSAGDVNGDGIDDILIGADRAGPNVGDPAGESYVVFGGPGMGASGSISLSELNGTNGFVVNGTNENDHSGFSVYSAGDVNADGIDDVLIGTKVGSPGGAGNCYVIFGGPTVGALGSINLSSLNGSIGFVLNGIEAGDDAGRSVSSAGDVNGDGIDDILIGAAYAGPNGQPYAGQSYVVFGRRCAGDVNIDQVTNVADFAILAGHFGQAPAPGTTGDLNGDGLVNVGDFNILASNFGCGE